MTFLLMMNVRKLLTITVNDFRCECAYDLHPCFCARVFGTSMVEEYEEIADPSERPDDQDDDLGKNR